jgi:NADPH:quinone reductase-like Zn-dependent oxidoreductase
MNRQYDARDGRLSLRLAHIPCDTRTRPSREVVGAGKGITRFKVGDRVLGFANGVDKPRNSPTECAFQLYTVLPKNLASIIPDSMSYEQAAAILLGAGAAACSLYEKNQLGLPCPSLKPDSTSKALIIWGGSASVGCNAIHLVKASGFDAIATSSPRIFDLCKSLGASHVLNYNSKTVVNDTLAACMELWSLAMVARKHAAQ